jgi:bacterioferritin
MNEQIQTFCNELNGDLERERKAQIQYEQHASLLSGWYFAFSNEILEHAAEEREHANKLNDLIVLLGGVPSVLVETPEISSDCHEMCVQDLSGENEAIARYKERIQQARDFGITEAEYVLLDILNDETGHKNFLLSVLGE